MRCKTCTLNAASEWNSVTSILITRHCCEIFAELPAILSKVTTDRGPNNRSGSITARTDAMILVPVVTNTFHQADHCSSALYILTYGREQSSESSERGKAKNSKNERRKRRVVDQTQNRPCILLIRLPPFLVVALGGGVDPASLSILGVLALRAGAIIWSRCSRTILAVANSA